MQNWILDAFQNNFLFQNVISTLIYYLMKQETSYYVDIFRRFVKCNDTRITTAKQAYGHTLLI
jgi:hypothetical protein